MTIAIQQWLGTRLDLLGNLLVLGIALFAAGFSKTISPSKVGVVLSYTLSSKCRRLPLSITEQLILPLVTQTFCKSFYVLVNPR